MSLTAKRTNDWVLDKAEMSRNLLESVKSRKLTYFGQLSLASTNVTSAVEVFLNDMRCINPRFTYFTYLITHVFREVIRRESREADNARNNI